MDAIRLLADTVLLTWRAVAKDGAELPSHQATMRPARLLMGTGESADVEVTTAEPRELTLEILTAGRAGLTPIRTRIPVRIRE